MQGIIKLDFGFLKMQATYTYKQHAKLKFKKSQFMLANETFNHAFSFQIYSYVAPVPEQ